MLKQTRNWWALGLSGAVVAGLASGCGDDFASCKEVRTCEAASGGETGDAGEPGSGIARSGGASGAEPGSGGTVSEAGAPSIGGEGGGGAGGDTSECADGYVDWFNSSFSFPDGDVIGTADFPSVPWAKTGDLHIETGRLTGVGTASASQGGAVPYADARLRFRVRFTDAKQLVTTAFDAAKDGSAGVRITLDSAGSLSLTDGKAVLGSTDFAPLETGVESCLEATFRGGAANISVARMNYGAERQARVEAGLSIDALKLTAAGTVAVADLVSASGVAPYLDELVFSRCGVPAPEYQPLLVDTFERPDSTTIGYAELPTTSAWKTSAGSVRIVSGALESKSLGTATIPLKVPTSGLRLRTTVRMVDGTNPYLWADVSYNVTAGARGPKLPGFWVWGGPSDGYLVTQVFGGVGGDSKHNALLAPDVPYFVQLDRDGDFAVLTVRTQSFAGPILAVEAKNGLTATADTGSFLTVGDEGGDGTRFDDIRVDSYPSK